MIAGYMRSAGKCASFGWQGGEPLLAGIGFFKRVVAYQQEYGLSAQLVSNNVQTNGTLLTGEWAEFFRQYNFFIGVSLDGPEEYHNHYRHSAKGNNSFRLAMEGIRALKNHQVDFSILIVVNDVTVKKPLELYNFFLSNGFHTLQFIPCVDIDRETGKPKDCSVSVEDYRDFLCVLFDVWYNNGKPIPSVRLFENILAIYMGVEPEICALKNQCGSYVVIEYNGDAYPCDFFVEGKWKLGNLLETPIHEMTENRKAQTFNRGKMRQSSGCDACEWNFICHFGCPHYRSDNGKNYLCEAYKEFYRYARQRFNILKDSLSR